MTYLIHLSVPNRKALILLTRAGDGLLLLVLAFSGADCISEARER